MSTATAITTGRDRRDGLRLAASRLLLGLVPAALTGWLAFAALRYHWVAFDFYRAYYPAGHRLLDGANPYAVTHTEIIQGSAFVYPALAAVGFVPFALVGREASDHLYTLLCLLCVIATLRVTGVRDWRIYGVTFLWFPIVIGWQGENVSVPLAFLVALAWARRDRPLVIGLVGAAAISLKPLVWPLALWLLATRRWRAAAWMLGWGLALNLAAWAIVGFNEIRTYLHLSAEVSDALWRNGYSILAVAGKLGLGRGAGTVLLVIAAAALILAVLYTGLVQRRERAAMTLAVALMLVASPLVWIHYFALLLVPMAISRPRFDRTWAVPIAMWLLPSAMTLNGWQLTLAWGVAAACFAAALKAIEPSVLTRAGTLRPSELVAGPAATATTAATATD